MAALQKDTSRMISLLDHWYFHIPNYLLAILMYMVLGRLFLSFLFQPNSQNLLFRSFVTITDPVVASVRTITPAIAPHGMVLLFSFFWIFVVRVVFFIVMAANALIPAFG